MKFSESELLEFCEKHLTRLTNVKFTIDKRTLNFPLELTLTEIIYTEDYDDFGRSYELESHIDLMEIYLDEFEFDITHNKLNENKFYYGSLEKLKEQKNEI